MRQRREHGARVLGVAGQHRVEVVLVVADELRPAAMPAREIVERDDARQRIEPAELGIGAKQRKAQRLCHVVRRQSLTLSLAISMLSLWPGAAATASQSISSASPGPVGTGSMPFFCRSMPGRSAGDRSLEGAGVRLALHGLERSASPRRDERSPFRRRCRTCRYAGHIDIMRRCELGHAPRLA